MKKSIMPQRWLLIGILIFFRLNVACSQGIHSMPFVAPTDPAIGKPCPDVELSHIINYPESQARISDFKGKILIIDFYTTHCRGCILSFPKYDSLQKEFGDKIQILLCTGEPEDAVRKLFSRIQGLKNIHLASVVSDTVLRNIFKHRLVPHVVVIDKEGIVRAVTYGINKKDIEDLLAGREINLPVKNDMLDYNPETPQMINDYNYYGRKDHFYFYTYLAPFNITTSPPRGIVKDSLGNIIRIELPATIQSIYKMAYGKGDQFNNSRIWMHFKDASSFKKVDWDKGINCYTYELILHPGWPASKAYKFMQSQLDAFFNLRSSMQKENVKCLVLKRISPDISKLLTKGGKAYGERIGKTLIFKNAAWWIIVNSINWGMVPTPPPLQIVDKTNINPYQKVDIDINTDFADMEEVNQSLRKYGLVLSVESLPMYVIVLKDR
ncbi:MAG: redoxin domain-containing protein [Chitinophagaceae bacterium]|nr:MAG: redoxin domain-containing protein [Chitinophagaceae bacterium]